MNGIPGYYQYWEAARPAVEEAVLAAVAVSGAARPPHWEDAHPDELRPGVEEAVLAATPGPTVRERAVAVGVLPGGFRIGDTVWDVIREAKGIVVGESIEPENRHESVCVWQFSRSGGDEFDILVSDLVQRTVRA
eukprot:gene34781-54751_t